MHNNITSYAWKPDHYSINRAAIHKRNIREAMRKTQKSTDWLHLNQKTIEDIHELYTNTWKDVRNTLDTRTDVLRLIKNGIVLAEYPLTPFKTNEIRPIEKAA